MILCGPVCFQVFGRLTLHIIISSLRDSRDAFVLVTNINEFIATFSYHVNTLVSQLRHLSFSGCPYSLAVPSPPTQQIVVGLAMAACS